MKKLSLTLMSIILALCSVLFVVSMCFNSTIARAESVEGFSMLGASVKVPKGEDDSGIRFEATITEAAVNEITATAGTDPVYFGIKMEYGGVQKDVVLTVDDKDKIQDAEKANDFNEIAYDNGVCTLTAITIYNEAKIKEDLIGKGWIVGDGSDEALYQKYLSKIYATEITAIPFYQIGNGNQVLMNASTETRSIWGVASAGYFDKESNCWENGEFILVKYFNPQANVINAEYAIESQEIKADGVSNISKIYYGSENIEFTKENDRVFVDDASALGNIKIGDTFDVGCIMDNSNYFYAVNVTVVSAAQTIADPLSVSALDGTINHSALSGKTIQSAKLGETDLNVSDGKITDLPVKILADNSGVENSSISVITDGEIDNVFNFTNVKVYSHIITEESDLQVLAQNATNRGASPTAPITGYYILGNNIVPETGEGKDNVVTIDHDNNLIKAGGWGTAMDPLYAFNGVFDGQGYSIDKFQPGFGGLFGALYATYDGDAKAYKNTEIKNIALTNLQSVSVPQSMFSNSDFNYHTGYSILANVSGGYSHGKILISNLHVDIDNLTYNNNGNPNCAGLIRGMDATAFSQDSLYPLQDNGIDGAKRVKMSNVYFVVENERDSMTFSNSATNVFGSLFSSVHGRLVANQSELDSAANENFSNIVTVSKSLAPSVYFRGGQSFGLNRKIFYGQNNEGQTNNYLFPWLDEIGDNPDTSETETDYVIKYNSPITKQTGSLIINNVYRYDTVAGIGVAQAQALADTGYWTVTYQGEGDAKTVSSVAWGAPQA